MTEDSTMSLKVIDTGSLSVNQYGWINIWTAILGHFFAQFPAFFEGRRNVGQNQAVNVSDNADIMRIYALLFFCVLGIKRDARLIQKHTTFSSCRHFQPG
ncbi:hypothetical protein UJ18_002073 [Salmonella enterica subsp. enterica serovar Pomona]|nr:DUF2684 domain-containing protein [Salmonella enterica subsp. enterica serovar Virchow]EDV0940093.1 hypothetical protein [Salmonella enterica subsp. enterica serovar Pomona]